MRTGDTKKRILDAGLKAFSEKGYLGATTKEIAGRAGVAELTLFRHFSSKQKLFEEVIRNYSFLPTLKELLPEISGLDYEEALSVIAERFLAILTLRKDLIRIMHSEIHRYPEKIHEIYHSFIDGVFETLASYFSDLQKKGVLRKFNAEAGARAFLGMFFSYFNVQEIMMRKKYRQTDTERIIREYVLIFTEGTLADARGVTGRNEYVIPTRRIAEAARHYR